MRDSAGLTPEFAALPAALTTNSVGERDPIATAQHPRRARNPGVATQNLLCSHYRVLPRQRNSVRWPEAPAGSALAQ